MREFVSLKELAAYSGLSVRTLFTYLRQATHPLPHYRLGGRVLVRLSEFLAWMEHYKMTQPAEAPDELVRRLAFGD